MLGSQCLPFKSLPNWANPRGCNIPAVVCTWKSWEITEGLMGKRLYFQLLYPILVRDDLLAVLKRKSRGQSPSWGQSSSWLQCAWTQWTLGVLRLCMRMMKQQFCGPLSIQTRATCRLYALLGEVAGSRLPSVVTAWWAVWGDKAWGRACRKPVLLPCFRTRSLIHDLDFLVSGTEDEHLVSSGLIAS